VLREKPLQAGKFVGVLLALGLAVAGFLRLVDLGGAVGSPLLGDGQFLALLLLPPVGLGLALLVSLEAAVSVYRAVRSDRSLVEQATDRPGYLLLRGTEAGVAILGVGIVAAVVPVLFAGSTPGPAGVGILLLLFVVGIGILCASLVRSAAELFVYGASP
jgi:hypothetical protein